MREAAEAGHAAAAATLHSSLGQEDLWVCCAGPRAALALVPHCRVVVVQVPRGQVVLREERAIVREGSIR